MQYFRGRLLVVLGGVLVALTLALAACGRSGDSPAAGNATSAGQRVFEETCAGCHAASTQQKIGPGLAGLFAPGGPALPAGVDYDGKLPNGAAITEANVAAWIRTGGQGQIGRMPGIPVGEQEMTALLAYLKTLEP